jgi:adenine-specific DNA methylase
MSGPNGKRLIEVAFPLKQASIDSVHEKNVRHGHISTLHIWPARRPLAASRAALIATLLPDPGDKEKRDEILKKLGGTVVKSVKRKKLPSGKVEDVVSEETQGGILHWGRESGPDLDWFRAEIRKAYGGRAPKVLDPFAGGGAIPLEAMRLGCEVTAVDINPVAWFILKCTLEYPQKLAGQKRRLPDFALADRDFMAAYLKALGLKPAAIRTQLDLLARQMPKESQGEMFEHLQLDPALLEADLAWHVRAWGRWVLREARRELARFYPTYAEFCSIKPYRRVPLARGAEEQLKLVSTNEAGEPQIELLNAGFDKKSYLDNDKNPRWVAKPTVAYLWARTVKCKACRATVPLLKTRWLAKKDNKRVVLTMEANADRTGMVFGIDREAKVQGGNAAQRREYDKKRSAGTMSRSGAACPCCGTIMTMEDMRLEARAGRLGTVLTAVVVDGPDGKEYRLPTAHEIEMAQAAEGESARVFADVPFGLPMEPLAGADALGFRVPLYGFDQWHKLYTSRELLALGCFAKATRSLQQDMPVTDPEWREGVFAYLAIAIDRLAMMSTTLCRWENGGEFTVQTFARFALPMLWDFAETNALSELTGGYSGGVEWISRYVEHALVAAQGQARVVQRSATQTLTETFDVVVTDPPYYDAIPYSDLMDFFYVWLRRTLHGISVEFDRAFAQPLAPKWDHEASDGELIDDASRFGGDKQASKRNYEAGMARAFKACHAALEPDGRLVIVFAHKQPDAWEALVSAVIQAGFVVDGSWPIQTEREARARAHASAALSSSVWLVCKKRDPLARAGWDAQVLKEMEAGIVSKLRDFWDAGIRGPDFVWAATGPALEAYSQYPAVKKASEPNALMTVTEFLRHVRRIVVDFVVGRVLTRGDAVAIDGAGLDDVTTYYLLHRNDFGLKDAPAGACILYAVSCNLSERQLADQYEILSRGKGTAVEEEDEDAEAEEGAEEVETSGGGGTFRLRAWSHRKHRMLGLDSEGGRAAPLIDQVHKLMHLWKGGDVNKVNEYLDSRGLRRSPIFAQLLQALIELAPHADEERSILESLSNHVRSLGAAAQGALPV